MGGGPRDMAMSVEKDVSWLQLKECEKRDLRR